jgi:hypothetical protein
MGRIQNRVFSAKELNVRKPILAILALSLLAVPAAADVTYEEVTKMGGMMKMMGMGKPTTSTTRLKGEFLRTDNGEQATIIDLAGEKILTLDNKKKTYSVMTFAEMKQKMSEAMAKMQGKKAEKSAEGSDVSMKSDVKVTETGRSETIQGLACKQYLMELALTVQSEKEKQSGTMSTLMEMWMAKDVPGSAEVNAFYRRMAEKTGTASIGQAWAAGAQGQNQAFGADMQKMADEMKKMDGHAMRSVMYMGDPEAAKKEALGEKPAEPEGGGGGGLAEMMKKMQGGGGQGGGGGVMMKMTTETTKVSTGPIDPSVFAVPSDYKLVTAR